MTNGEAGMTRGEAGMTRGIAGMTRGDSHPEGSGLTLALQQINTERNLTTEGTEG